MAALLSAKGITDDFIREVLLEGHGSGEVQWSIEPFGEGEGFLSTMSLVSVTCAAVGKKEFVVKEVGSAAIVGEEMHSLMSLLQRNELNFYRTVAGVASLPIPAVLYPTEDVTATEQVPMLVMERVKEMAIGDFVTGLTIEQTKATITAMAQLHGLPGFFRPPGTADETYYKTWTTLNDHLDFVKSLTSELVPRLQKELTLRRGNEREWSRRLAELSERIDDIYEATHGGFLTSKSLCNGDLWMNNVLLGQEGATLIDFQFSGLLSPVLDVALLLYSSVNADTLHQNEKELLLHYHSCLMDQSGMADKDYSFTTFSREYFEWGVGAAAMVMVASFDACYEGIIAKQPSAWQTLLPRLQAALCTATS